MLAVNEGMMQTHLRKSTSVRFLIVVESFRCHSRILELENVHTVHRGFCHKEIPGTEGAHVLKKVNHKFLPRVSYLSASTFFCLGSFGWENMAFRYCGTNIFYL